MSTEQIAEFHGDIDLLGRLNNALNMARIGQSNNDPTTWFRGLEMVYCELTTEMSLDQKQRLRQQSKQLAEQINKHLAITMNPRNRQYKSPITQDLVDSLKDYEDELQNIFKKSGLKMKIGKDSRAAFG